MATAGPSNRTPTKPYGSARDIPSFRQMETQLQGMKLLTRVIARDQRKHLIEIERKMLRLTELVDDFYERLGPRNWIFHDYLSLDKIEALLSETSSVEAAESRLIDLYRDSETTKWRMIGFRSQDGLRERLHQVERALEHYEAGHFNSCVLQLIAVMDGYVNDLDPGARKGLAARDPDDMTAWDSIVGHHMGLTHVMKTFTKSIKKRIDEEVHDVYRHGIVHGSVVNFDNVVVATKAWNLLYSVVDWAQATKKAAVPEEPGPTFTESLEQLSRNRRFRKHSDEFVPWTLDPAAPEFASHPAAAAASAFLEAWRHGRWELITPFIPEALRGCESKGQAAKRAKEIYGAYRIDDYKITAMNFDRACLVDIRGSAIVANEPRDLCFRMSERATDDYPALPGDRGTRWCLAVWPPHTLFE